MKLRYLFLMLFMITNAVYSQDVERVDSKSARALLREYLQKRSATNLPPTDELLPRIAAADCGIIYALGLKDDEDVRMLLLSQLDSSYRWTNRWTKFHCAVALAAQGVTNGAPVLRKAFTAKSPFMTSSCFELQIAGLALLCLGEDAPADFSFKMEFNDLFPEAENMRQKKTPNHGLESTGAPPAAGTPETHP